MVIASGHVEDKGARGYGLKGQDPKYDFCTFLHIFRPKGRNDREARWRIREIKGDGGV